MRLLIIEDNRELSDMLVRELMACDRGQTAIESIAQAGDFEMAVITIEAGGVDAILCDGWFPARPGLQPLEYWPNVAEFADLQPKPIRVVVYSADDDVLIRAGMTGLRALRKPSPGEKLYRALVAPALMPVQAQPGVAVPPRT